MKKLVLALVALAAIVAVATPAVADYNFYGSMRMATYYKYDDNANANKETASLGLASNSRFGAKATTGAIGGRVEFGLYNNPATATTTAGDKVLKGEGTYLRLLYGTYKTDAGTLLIGQTYTPYFGQLSTVTNADNFQHGFGSTYDGRQPQVRFDMTSGLYMAAIRNSKNGTEDQFIPKLALGFKNKAGAISYNVGFAYQGINNAAHDITSYLGYADMDYKQDAMSAKVKLHVGKNLKDFGISPRKFSAYDAVNNKSVLSYGAIAQVSMSGATVGASYTVDDSYMGATKTNKDFTAFVNYAIKPVKGFSITPEIAIRDYDVNAFDFDGNDEVYAYVKWQMDF